MGESSEANSLGDQLVQQHGLEPVADLRVEAHGSIYSVRDALGQCEPFAKFVTGVAASVEFLPADQAKEVLTQAVRNMAIEAPEETGKTQNLALPQPGIQSPAI